METLTATFKIVTPMFIAGADQKKAELRAPSIKGALRFWWRALNWARVQNLQDLRVEEAGLFGDAGDTAQSKILLTLNKPLIENSHGNALVGNDNALSYLGYGLFKMGDHQERKAIPEGKTFQLRILFRPGVQATQRQQLTDAIRTLGLMGGLGSRTRNGFGSISLDELNGEELTYSSLPIYENALNKLLMTSSNDDEPPFTSISNLTRVVCGPMHSNAVRAHQFIGRLYKNFRTERPHTPNKKFFGLPLQGGYDENNRRASPLMFHIHPVGSQYVPVLVYMPAKFHPKYERHNYSLVESFIDEFTRPAA